MTLTDSVIGLEVSMVASLERLANLSKKGIRFAEVARVLSLGREM